MEERAEAKVMALFHILICFFNGCVHFFSLSLPLLSCVRACVQELNILSLEKGEFVEGQMGEEAFGRYLKIKHRPKAQELFAQQQQACTLTRDQWMIILPFQVFIFFFKSSEPLQLLNKQKLIAPLKAINALWMSRLRWFTLTHTLPFIYGGLLLLSLKARSNVIMLLSTI